MNQNKEIPRHVSILTKLFDKFEHILSRQLSNEQSTNNVQNFVNSRKTISESQWRNNMNGVLSDYSSDEEPNERSVTCEIFTALLENTLRDAKPLYLHCSEILIPQKLTTRLAKEIALASETEPCGFRGCIIYIHVQEKKRDSRKIGVIRIDPYTVPTFEINLTLFQDTSSWLSLRQLIPQKLLKTVGQKTTLVISEHFNITKKKLYRSDSV